MTFALKWSEAAERDLDKAVGYIAQYNPWAAVKFLRKVEKTLATWQTACNGTGAANMLKAAASFWCATIW